MAEGHSVATARARLARTRRRVTEPVGKYSHAEFLLEARRRGTMRKQSRGRRASFVRARGEEQHRPQKGLDRFVNLLRLLHSETLDTAPPYKPARYRGTAWVVGINGTSNALVSSVLCLTVGAGRRGRPRIPRTARVRGGSVRLISDAMRRYRLENATFHHTHQATRKH
jgi:hypothetical protein